MFSDLLNQAPPLRLNQKEVKQLLSNDEFDQEMTSIDLHKEFNSSKKEGTGGRFSPPRGGDYNNQSEFLDSETRIDLKLILDQNTSNSTTAPQTAAGTKKSKYLKNQGKLAGNAYGLLK